MHRILGIVAEYNPFHRGHLHQLKSAQAETDCQYTVIAMSGNFVQRGEPAIFDKWVRAEMALTAGADLVLEVPTYHVLQSAQGFARSAMAILAGCGTTVLSFGSESNNKEELVALATWLDQDLAQQEIRKGLSRGINYAAAVYKAVQATPGKSHLAPLLTGANDILAVEYIRAIRRYSPDISFHPIRRVGQGSKDYMSASQLRALLAQGRVEEATTHIPQDLRATFARASAVPVFTEDFTQALFYALLTMGRKKIRSLPACSEGLEYRVLRAISSHRSIPALIDAIKTKRYPRTRIQRLLMQALLQFQGVRADEGYIPYLRVLACSTRGKELLPLLASENNAPLIFSARDYKKITPPASHLLRLDQRAANIYSLAGKIPPRENYPELVFS